MVHLSERLSRKVLLLGTLVMLSVLYQFHFLEFNEGEVTGGGAVRMLLKVLAVCLLLLASLRVLSFRVLHLNLLLKLPLFFVCGTIFLVMPYLNQAYLQAVNLFFFLPIFFFDWNKDGADSFYRRIWGQVIVIVSLQLLFEPVLRLFLPALWENGAYVGGMGNPNVFGAFLVCAGLACMYLYPRYRSLGLLLLLSTALTGSLVSALIGFGFMGFFVVKIFLSSLRRMIIFLSGGALAVTLLLNVDFIRHSVAVQHVMGKFKGLLNLLSGEAQIGTASVSGRIEYFTNGVALLRESPLGVLFGHPEMIPMYNGDGLWTSFFVSYGVPATLLFLLSNLYLILRGMKSSEPNAVFSAFVLAALNFFFVTNRILDYWPTGFLYVTTFSYLAIRGVRPAYASVAQT